MQLPLSPPNVNGVCYSVKTVIPLTALRAFFFIERFQRCHFKKIKTRFNVLHLWNQRV